MRHSRGYWYGKAFEVCLWGFIALLVWIFSGCEARGDSLAWKHWEVETSDPAPYDFELFRGETVYLKPTYLSYRVPVQLDDVYAVVLQYWNSAIPSDRHWGITGLVSGASATFTFGPSDFPPGNSATYTIAARTLKGDTLRAFGTIKIRATVAGIYTNVPRTLTTIDWATIDNANLSAAPFAIDGSGGGGGTANSLTNHDQLQGVRGNGSNHVSEAEVDRIAAAVVTNALGRIGQIANNTNVVVVTADNAYPTNVTGSYYWNAGLSSWFNSANRCAIYFVYDNLLQLDNGEDGWFSGYTGDPVFPCLGSAQGSWSGSVTFNYGTVTNWTGKPGTTLIVSGATFQASSYSGDGGGLTNLHVQGGAGNYTNTMINDTPHTNMIRFSDWVNSIWTNVDGAWRLIVPVMEGPRGEQGPPGQAVTNLTVAVTTNLNITSIVITNINIGGGGGGGVTSLNGLIGGVTLSASGGLTLSTNGQTLVFSNTLVGGSGGVMGDTWSSTGSLYAAVGGMTMVRFDTNGITMLHGSVQLYEENLDCNVNLYDGNRNVPSLTFKGHTNEWGLYGRGYNGHQIAGWSVGGTEVGLIHADGIRLISSNSAFEGRLLGDISGATGYPEPIFAAWRTNMSFSSLLLSNLVIVPGTLTVKDGAGTARVVANNSSLSVNDVGGITRTKLDTGLQVNNSTGLRITKILSGLTTYDAVSQMALLSCGGDDGPDVISYKISNGYYMWKLSAGNGLALYDGNLLTFRAGMDPVNGVRLFDSTGSNLVFQADLSGTVRGSNFWYAKAAPTNMTGFVLTNVFANVTNRLWFSSQGVVTNHVP